MEFATNHIDLADNQYSIIQSGFEYQLTNLDTNWNTTFQADPQMYSIQPLQDGFLYSAMDEEKYTAYTNTIFPIPLLHTNSFPMMQMVI
jgi:hypothetical protein